MNIVILTNVLAILFAFLESKKILKNGLLLSFFVLFVFLALRFDYGNDYMMYFKGFDDINSIGWSEIYNEKLHFEPGWVVLCIIFEPIGFFGMVAFFSFLWCHVFYKLISDYVPIKLYWFAMFVLVFSTGNLLTHLSAMRQTLVIIIFIYSLQFIFNKQLLLYLVAIGVASTFHSSALLLFPIYFLQFVNFKINKYISITIVLLYIIFYLVGQQIRPFLNLLILSIHEDYLFYDDEGSFNSGFGLIINSFVFILILAHDKYYEGKLSFLIKLGVISYILSPFGLIILLIGRVQMYFSVFLIVVYCLVYDSIKPKILKLAFLGVLILLTLVTFFEFFKSPIWIDKFKEYQTIFSY